MAFAEPPPGDVDSKVTVLSLEVQAVSEKLDDVLTTLNTLSNNAVGSFHAGGGAGANNSHASPPRQGIELNSSASIGFFPRSAAGGGAQPAAAGPSGAPRKKVVRSLGPGGAADHGSMRFRAPTMRRRASNANVAVKLPNADGGAAAEDSTSGLTSPRNAEEMERKISFSDPTFGKRANDSAPATPGSNALQVNVAHADGDGKPGSSGGAPPPAAVQPPTPGTTPPPQQPQQHAFGGTLGHGAAGGGMLQLSSSPLAGVPRRQSQSLSAGNEDGNPLVGSSFEVSDNGRRRRRQRHKDGMEASTRPVCATDGQPQQVSAFTRFKDKLVHTVTTKSLGADDPVVIALEAVYIIISFLYTLTTISVFISPIDDSATRQPRPFAIALAVVFNVYLFVWMILRCWTRRKRGAELVDDPAAIRGEYMRSGWFILDVLNTFPIEFALLPVSSVGFYALLARHGLFGIIRSANMANSNDPLQPEKRLWVLLTFFSLTAVTLGHFTACLYWRLEETDNSSSGNGTPLTYTDALYYAMATLTSTGYGDLVASKQDTRIFSVVMQFVGVALVSGLTAVATSVLTTKDALQEEQDRMRRMMGSMLRHYQIPFSLQREVVAMFPTVLAAASENSFKDMIRLLPSFMERRIEDYLRAKLLRQVPLFAALPVSERADDAHQCEPGEEAQDVVLEVSRKLKVRYAAPWDYIITAGDTGEEMFILVHGAVDVLIPTGKTKTVEVMYEDGTAGFEEEEEEQTVATLRSGSFFGEIALIEDTKRTASVQAIQGCELLTLSRSDFNGLVARSSALQQALADAVKKRRDQISEQQKKVIQSIAIVPTQESNETALVVEDADGEVNTNPLKAATVKVIAQRRAERSNDNSRPNTGSSPASAESSGGST